jgi:hypothetical protein
MDAATRTLVRERGTPANTTYCPRRRLPSSPSTSSTSSPSSIAAVMPLDLALACHHCNATGPKSHGHRPGLGPDCPPLQPASGRLGRAFQEGRDLGRGPDPDRSGDCLCPRDERARLGRTPGRLRGPGRGRAGGREPLSPVVRRSPRREALGCTTVRPHRAGRG